MNGRDFIEVARHLVAEPSPAAVRTAVSRSYYAAFHVCAEFLKDLSFTIPRSVKAHRIVSEYLDYSEDIELEEAAKELADLRQARNEADYDLDNFGAEGAKTATALILVAEEIMSRAEACCADPERRETVRTAIASFIGKTHRRSRSV